MEMHFNRETQCSHTGVPYIFINGWQFHPRSRLHSDTYTAKVQTQITRGTIASPGLKMFTKHSTFRKKLWHSSGKTEISLLWRKHDWRQHLTFKMAEISPLIVQEQLPLDTNDNFFNSFEEAFCWRLKDFPNTCLLWYASDITDIAFNKISRRYVFLTQSIYSF